MNNFHKLGLTDQTLTVLDHLGFTIPTPIQAQAIPKLLHQDPVDFIGLAQTGTGKTAAFGLPLMDLIDPDIKKVQALIMAPTRELGQQTAQQLMAFSQNNKLRTEVVYGGVAITNQIRALKKSTQIVVATPGRLLDLIKRKAIQLENVRYVILDEADEMLNMGFKEDIDQILSHTNEDHATWLFSATMPAAIRRIVKKYMETPLEVSINTKDTINKDIIHEYVITKTANKIPALRRFLDMQPDMRGIMFCRTKRETQRISDELTGLGYGTEALHGDLSQAQRDMVMKRFKNRSMQLLIATDVAARGIDVQNLTHVIHHTLPDQLESYTHRSGRTARAGNKGVSLAFINPREGKKIEVLEKKVNVSFKKIAVPGIEELRSSRMNNWANLIINTDVDGQADEILQTLHGKFNHLNKEDILRRLITTQLDHLTFQNGDDSDLNETQPASHSGKKGKNGNVRYFINIGMMDGVTKADLIHIITDVSGLEKSTIQDVRLQKNCSFFDAEGISVNQLCESFKGITVGGRSIRVDRDEDTSGSGVGKRRNRKAKRSRSNYGISKRKSARRKKQNH